MKRTVLPSRLLVRVCAVLLSVVIALVCTHWATADSDTPSIAAASDAFEGATGWINSPPLNARALQGRVVLLDFWTYSCINCLRTLPYVRAWAQKYAAHGLVVIGVHTPEFGFERSTTNVQRAVKALGIDYPVAVDSQQAIWNTFGVQGWPAFYVIDATGRVRHRQLGEGRYEQTERMIQQLLRDAGRQHVPDDLVAPRGEGTQAAAGALAPDSPETYLGAARATGFVAAMGELRAGRSIAYSPAPRLQLNQWTLAGTWAVTEQQLELAQAGGRIALRFRARDLHLVLGPARQGQAVRFRVRIDGEVPGTDHGSDIAADGTGRIKATRLYQLVRQSHGDRERLFEIEFLAPGARAYAFTFG